MSFRRTLVALGPVALLAGSSFVTPAFADRVDDASAKVFELEGRLTALEGSLRPPEEEKGQLAERRLIDAEVAYELKNYDASSIILYDLIEKYPTSSVYGEALYYLADSLYLKRDYFSSRRYFEKLVEAGPTNAKYQQALERLVELSLHTGDYAPVDGYLAKLAQLPQSQQLVTVPYVAGKYYYFRRQFEQAITTLRTIPVGSKYYMHGMYFIGAANVALGKAHLPDAMAAFEAIIAAVPPEPAAQPKPGEPVPATLDAAQVLIVELAHLGRARILLDQGKLPEAINEYAKVRNGPNFNDALYESAWVSIKGKDYVKATRQLDLLLLDNPDSTLAPEVRLLSGNLYIRQTRWGDAAASFTKTREDYEPLSKEITAALNQEGDAVAYFRGQIAKNLTHFDLAKIVPADAVRWMKDDGDTNRLRGLLSDESELGQQLTDTDDTIRRLERAVNGAGKVNVFPELARARMKGVEIDNSLIEQKKILGARERQLMDPVAGDQMPELVAIEAERNMLEERLHQLPTKDDTIVERQKKARAAFNEIDKHAVEVQVALLGVRAQLVATGKFYRDSVQHTLTPDQQREALAELDRRMAELDEEQAGIDAVRKDLEDAGQSIGADDSDMRAGEAVKQQYAELLRRQNALLVKVSSRMSGADRAKAEQIQAVLARADGIEQKLRVYNGKIDVLADEKLVPIRGTIDEEKGRVAGYRALLTGYDGESAEVGGGVLAQSLRSVSTRFYNIVVRSDVGIIDVAWALKDSATKETNRLVSERKRELKLLDDDFKEVLKENP
ncbi:MAG: tetratricopeptide repeat protein [Polyangia bacterium]